MKNLYNGIVILFFLLILSLPITVLAQGKADNSKQLNIDNCVNTLSMDNTIKTEVGYQYWFVDKEFLEQTIRKILTK